MPAVSKKASEKPTTGPGAGLNVAFATSEVAPFCKTGGLGDVAGDLPRALAKLGCRVVVLCPKYASIDQKWVDEMEHVTHFYVSLGWRNEYCGLERIEREGVQFYFVDNEKYFGRPGLYGYFDDGERFAFFSKCVTESLQYLPDFSCNILHCNDWQTALSPVYLREFYQGLEAYEGVKTVFSVHNAKFQGKFGESVLDACGLLGVGAAVSQMQCGYQTVDFMQAALLYSDLLSTVSPTYAEELKTPFYGEGLDWAFARRGDALVGILNGIDRQAYNPETDSEIAAHFSAGNLAGKAECKRALQEELGLEVADGRPLVAMVGRLTKQKGLDLLNYAMERMLERSVQVAVLGTGDQYYEDALRYFDWKYPGSVAARIEFNPALSRRMYAGADLFLMPSLFEPCGLSQMIAMRYGTVPVVRETGGLKDSVQPYNQFSGEGTGFSFTNFNGDEMFDAVMRACEVFWTDEGAWQEIQRHGMKADFSWNKSAEAYVEMYRRLVPAPPVVVEPEVKDVPEKKKAPAIKASGAKEPAASKKAASAKKPAAKKKAAPKAASAEKKPAAVTKAASAEKKQAAVKETASAKKAPVVKKAPDKKASISKKKVTR